MPRVAQVQLLGDFRLTCDDIPVDGMRAPRLQSLIAYLALHRDAPQSRQRLAFLFWPDSSEAQARNNLRQLLHALRHTSPDISAYLLIDNQTMQWRRDITLRLDAADVEQALAEVERDDAPHDAHALRAAGERLLALYRADLLPGCYDEWIAPERERLHDRVVHALERLASLHEAQGDLATAIPFARRLIRADPLHEEAYRTLMRLRALTGDRAGELRAYRACVSALRQALGIEPGQATEELHQRLLLLDAPPALRERHESARDTAAPVSTETIAVPHALVGRAREWETLQRAWQEASAGSPSFVLITGEPGIGKSRLAEEMARSVGAGGVTTATARSYAVEGRLSFASVIEWLRSPGLRPYVRRLEPVWLTEVARVLPELLAENPGLPHYEPLTEYGQRQYFFQALALATLSAPQPLLLVMDDLQWCDQETLEWLHFLLRFDAGARLLVLGIARSEETPPHHPLHLALIHLRHTVAVTEIPLRPLDAAETAELAARMMDHQLDVPAAMRLYDETEGNPLFVIETVRAGLDRLAERPARPLPGALEQPLDADDSPLPPSVRAVIASRLAQLSAPARELVALAAIIGREFSLDMLAQISQSDEESVVRALDELWLRRIVREQGPDTYDFTHDKLREVAYTEISAPQRHLLHRRVAQALEALYAENLDAVSGQIAAHYERGGATERAIPAYQRAAMVAQRVFAFEDAIHLLRRCLTLLERAPAGVARERQELHLLLALAPLYRITRGWTAPELEQVVNRTLALCDTVGDDTQRAEALYGFQSLLIVQARLEQVQVVADELHTLYERSEGAVPPLTDMMLAGSYLHLGRLRDASAAFARILSEHDMLRAQNLQESQGWNFAVHTRAWQSHAVWCLGAPAQAMRLGQDAVQLAQSLGQPFNQALAATYLAMLWQMSADAPTARTLADEAIALTIEYKAPYYRAWAAILLEYGHAQEQPDEAHIAALRAAITEFTASGARLRLPYFFSLLARIYLQADQPDNGLLAIEEALEQSRKNNERWWDAELHHLRGKLTLAAGHDVHAAEAALAEAVAIAQRQQMRPLELRALLALARLQEGTRQADAAIHALRALMDSYSTEGVDLPDLQAAQAYLAHLTRA